jgi:hypothetical protein
MDKVFVLKNGEKKFRKKSKFKHHVDYFFKVD